jgi:hypothetical protein
LLQIPICTFHQRYLDLAYRFFGRSGIEWKEHYHTGVGALEVPGQAVSIHSLRLIRLNVQVILFLQSSISSHSIRRLIRIVRLPSHHTSKLLSTYSHLRRGHKRADVQTKVPLILSPPELPQSLLACASRSFAHARRTTIVRGPSSLSLPHILPLHHLLPSPIQQSSDFFSRPVASVTSLSYCPVLCSHVRR